ncbi:MAG: DUF1810 family protein, partial [Oxalobacteraceae bacterium]
MNTDFNLERFVDAQAGVYDQALAELRAGRKRSHWMWFIFPQIAGLGQSDMARRYAIASTDEAAAYLAHPVLGPRLRRRRNGRGRSGTRLRPAPRQRTGSSTSGISGRPDSRRWHRPGGRRVRRPPRR